VAISFVSRRENIVEDELQKLKRWSSRGTLSQFYAEVSARASSAGVESELDGNTITFYRAHKEGGFLGIGGRTIKEPVLQIIRHDDSVEIPDDSIDEEFVLELAKSLRDH